MAASPRAAPSSPRSLSRASARRRLSADASARRRRSAPGPRPAHREGRAEAKQAPRSSAGCAGRASSFARPTSLVAAHRRRPEEARPPSRSARRSPASHEDHRGDQGIAPGRAGQGEHAQVRHGGGRGDRRGSSNHPTFSRGGRGVPGTRCTKTSPRARRIPPEVRVPEREGFRAVRGRRARRQGGGDRRRTGAAESSRRSSEGPLRPPPELHRRGGAERGSTHKRVAELAKAVESRVDDADAYAHSLTTWRSSRGHGENTRPSIGEGAG